MSQVSNVELKVQRHALNKFKKGVSYASQGLARTSMGVAQRKLQMYRAEVVSNSDLILAYSKLIDDQRDASGSWPVICIDEANVLMEWVTEGPAMEKDLNALLRFFVQVSCQALVYCTALAALCVHCADQIGCQLRASTHLQITKETPRAHVILATSDYNFLTWLQASKLSVECPVVCKAALQQLIPVDVCRGPGRLLLMWGYW